MPNVPIPVAKIDLFVEIANEQQRGLEKFGGPANDDTHEHTDWERYILRFASTSRKPFRERMLSIAGLAISAIEAHDRTKKEININIDTAGLSSATLKQIKDTIADHLSTR